MNPTAVIYVLTAAAIFGIGLYGLLVSRQILRQLLTINLMGGGIFLLLITLGGGAEGPPDPVPQAMVLTGIVIAVSATAFALALLLRWQELSGSSEVDGDAVTDAVTDALDDDE
ncbi:MAG: NADH-quinone oxidoreductase subunit K [Gammaproteobacteria bacterium]|nr:NADH-quinone oxidoreductase subunit K [Gammaproteobacteria bacterium]